MAPILRRFDEKLWGELGSRVQQLDADDTAFSVVIKYDVRSDFCALQNFSLRQTDIGRVVLGPIFDRRCHDGFRASRSKNTVRIRISSAVSKHATRSTRSPNSEIA